MYSFTVTHTKLANCVGIRIIPLLWECIPYNGSTCKEKKNVDCKSVSVCACACAKKKKSGMKCHLIWGKEEKLFPHFHPNSCLIDTLPLTVVYYVPLSHLLVNYTVFTVQANKSEPERCFTGK